jgi:hypothetical protein
MGTLPVVFRPLKTRQAAVDGPCSTSAPTSDTLDAGEMFEAGAAGLAIRASAAHAWSATRQGLDLSGLRDLRLFTGCRWGCILLVGSDEPPMSGCADLSCVTREVVSGQSPCPVRNNRRADRQDR